MDLKILAWSYRGIRGVNNLDIDISRTDSLPYHVSMIMMPNGLGKTTTMMLLRVVFDGSAKGWQPEFVRGFRPPGSNVKMGEFTVSLTIDGAKYVVLVQLDYVKGEATYKTSRVGSKGGLDDGLMLPSYVRSAFSKEFVRRFVFDGELAKQILSSTSREAEEAITYLYQLDRLGGIKTASDRILESEQDSKESKAKTNQGLAKLKTQRDSWKSTLKSLKVEERRLQNLLESKTQRLSELQVEIEHSFAKDTELGDDLKDLKLQRDDVANQIREIANQTLDAMRDPYVLFPLNAVRLQELLSGMERLKLPQAVSSQFFEELAQHDRCVCGHSIGEAERDYIREHASSYLAEDQIGAMNIIKSALIGRSNDDHITPLISQLRDSRKLFYSLNHQIDRLMTRQAESGNGVLREMLKESKQLETEITNLQFQLDQLTTTDKGKLERLTAQQNICLCERELNKAEDRVQEATHTVELSVRVARFQKYVSDIRAEALSRLKVKITDGTNSKIAKIIRTEKVEVKAIDPYLILKDKGGGSEGQSLAIAYSYLGSMFEGSTYKLPFVVDSPAGSLDLDVRRAVAPILPALFEQLVIFITSGEREGFADHYVDLGSNVHFLTVSKEAGKDAVCLPGVEPFRAFQGQDEEIPGEVKVL